MNIDPNTRPKNAAILQMELQTIARTETGASEETLPAIPSVSTTIMRSTNPTALAQAIPKRAFQSTSQTKISSLLAYWVLANITGWSSGRAIGWSAGSAIYRNTSSLSLGDGIYMYPAGLSLALETILLGVILTLSQFLIFRRYFPVNKWWIIGSVVAWICIGALGRIIGGLPGGAIIGLLIGIFQWVLLRPHIRKAWVWIVASLSSYACLWYFNGPSTAALFTFLGGTWQQVVYQRGIGWLIALILTHALLGAVFGLLTGIALLYLLQNKRS